MINLSGIFVLLEFLSSENQPYACGKPCLEWLAGVDLNPICLFPDRPCLDPVATKTGQLPLHGLVHEMNEFGQGILGAASRAAEDHGTSCPLQCQQALALVTPGFLFDHLFSF